MIQINYIEIPTADVYAPDDTFLGTVNEYQFNDIRIQIMRSNAVGYYVLLNGKKYQIGSNGSLLDWPTELFGIMEEQLMELIFGRDK